MKIQKLIIKIFFIEEYNINIANFIVLNAEIFPILRLYTVKYVVCIMIYFFEIYIDEKRKGFCI